MTSSNHFEFGRLKDFPKVFFSKLGAPNSSEQSGTAASIQAARIISEKSSLPLDLCISGGIDSEAMLRAFTGAGVNFRLNILRFADGFNDYDIREALDFCTASGYKFRIIDLDILQFFESGKYFEFGERYQCQSPQIAAHLWLLDQLDGCPVLAGNFIFPKLTPSGTFYQGLPGDLHCAYFRYFMKNNRPGIPWFFIYTPEQWRAFFNAHAIQLQLSRGLDDQCDFDYLTKCRIYQEAGFVVTPKKDKYTGFEKVRAHYDEKYGTDFGMKFNELFRAPLEKLNPLPSEYLQLVPYV